MGFTADGLNSSDSANHSLSLWINYSNTVKIINLWWGMLLEERGGVSTVQNKNAQQVQGAVCVASWSMAKLPAVLSIGKSEVGGRVDSLCTEISSFCPSFVQYVTLRVYWWLGWVLHSHLSVADCLTSDLSKPVSKTR